MRLELYKRQYTCLVVLVNEHFQGTDLEGENNESW